MNVNVNIGIITMTKQNLEVSCMADYLDNTKDSSPMLEAVVGLIFKESPSPINIFISDYLSVLENFERIKNEQHLLSPLLVLGATSVDVSLTDAELHIMGELTSNAVHVLHTENHGGAQ